MTKPKKFMFRREDGTIASFDGESADASLRKLGTVLSWDADLNTVDVRLPSGRIENVTMVGMR